MVVGLIIITAIIMIKYKPAYKISMGGQELGYVNNKIEFENKLQEALSQQEDVTIAFMTLSEEPEYEFKLVDNKEPTKEEEMIEMIKQNVDIRYTMYAITVNDIPSQYVATLEEAETAVEEIKQDNQDVILNINVKQLYSEEKPEIVEKSIAIANIENDTIPLLKAKNEIKPVPIAVINEVEIANKPVSGTITSRFGAVSRLRKSTHTGLDIATSTGTAIKACSTGTVTFSGYSGSYGYLVKISHGNGVETWYAHCSKLYVKKGQEVIAGERIAAVGSTGNSTGPHLHLEIRINGAAVNPQKYLYK